MVIWSGKSAIKSMWCIGFLIIREDLVQATLSILLAIVSMATLEALEFWLEEWLG
jgi:hypothetical protein